MSIEAITPISGASRVTRDEQRETIAAHTLVPVHLAPLHSLGEALDVTRSAELNPSVAPLHSGQMAHSLSTSSASPNRDTLRRMEPLDRSVALHSPPILTPPSRPLSTNYRDKLVALLDTSEKRVTRDIEYDTKKLSEISEDLEAEYQKFLAKIREIAAEEKSAESWSYLSRMASCLLSAGAMIAGGLMISSGAVLPGALMVTSGITGLAGLGLSHLGVDKRLTGAISLASAGISLLGGGLGYHLIANQSAKLILTIANAAFGVASGITTYEAGMADANKAFMQQQKIIHEQEIEIYKLSHLETSDDAKRTSTPLIELTSSVRKILKEQDQMNLRILQEVT